VTVVSSRADIIKFDNSYSWMNSKVVYYSVEVITKDPKQTTDGDIPSDASSGSTGFADSSDELEAHEVKAEPMASGHMGNGEVSHAN
jgi:hypothetical protein